MRRLLAALLLACSCAAATTAQQQGAAKSAGDDASARFKAQVEAISAGADTRARRAAITKPLDELGVRRSP